MSIVLLEVTVNIQLLKIESNSFGLYIVFRFYNIYNNK